MVNIKQEEDTHIKQEEDPIIISAYGISNRNTPERCPSPFYSQDSTQEDINPFRHYKEEDLNIVVVDSDPTLRAQNDRLKIDEEDFSPDINTDGGMPRTITAFKMRNINVQELIRAIEEHPELYDTSLASYSDCYKKKEAWVEVTRRVTPHWHTMSRKERELQERQLKIRWKSLRDRFKRDLNALGSQRTGSAKKVRIHRFFEKLQFLKASMTTRKSSGNVKEESEESLPIPVAEAAVEEEPEAEPSQQADSSVSISIPTEEKILRPSPQPRGKKMPKKKVSFPDPLSAEVMSVLGEMRDQLREAREREPARQEESISSFLISLGDDMRRISPERLPHVKFQLMQVVHQAIYTPATMPVSPFSTMYPSSNSSPFPPSSLPTDTHTQHDLYTPTPPPLHTSTSS
ncbi:uncharacterized protein [Pyxicephalus adspersus]|nr:TPA: hypothetical protein GDO54_004690 [Pyxicephalus adspersus]